MHRKSFISFAPTATMAAVFACLVAASAHAEEGVIPMPNGDVRPVLAMAAQKGEALGQVTGKAAAMVEKKFGKGAPIMVRAVRMRELVDGCPKVVARWYQPGTKFESEVAFKLCKK